MMANILSVIEKTLSFVDTNIFVFIIDIVGIASLIIGIISLGIAKSVKKAVAETKSTIQKMNNTEHFTILLERLPRNLDKFEQAEELLSLINQIESVHIQSQQLSNQKEKLSSCIKENYEEKKLSFSLNESYMEALAVAITELKNYKMSTID